MNHSAARARLKRLLSTPGPRTLSWYHTIGGLALQCLPSGPKYGETGALLNELVDSFDCRASSRESKIATLRSILDVSKAFHRAYTTAEVRILESPPAGSHPLTWNHLRILVRLPVKQRQQLQRAAISGRWSSARLTQELQQGRSRMNAGGRRIRKSPDTQQALYGLIRQSKRWLQRAQADWPADDEDLFVSMGESGDLKKALAEAMTTHAELRAQAETVQAALSRLQSRVRKSNRRKSR